MLQSTLSEQNLGDFPGLIDDATLATLDGLAGTAQGQLSAPRDGATDRDALRILAPPGARLVLSVEPTGGLLSPAMFAVNAQGQVLQLSRADAGAAASLRVLVPREGEILLVLDDARNLDGAQEGGDGFSYQLSANTEAPDIALLGEVSLEEERSSAGALSSPGDEVLFSFIGSPGETFTLSVEAAPGAALLPFLTVYSPSFDTGATAGGDEASISLLAAQRGREVLFGVSSADGKASGAFTLTVRRP
jgi:hypothetical protein